MKLLKKKIKKFKQIEFTDEDIKMINDTITELGLEGDKKMSEVLEELDKKYNISQGLINTNEK